MEKKWKFNQIVEFVTKKNSKNLQEYNINFQQKEKVAALDLPPNLLHLQ
jgi:hypothetical protein